MSKRKLLLLLVAGLVAVGTVLVARSLITPQEQVVEPAKIQTTEVLVATRDLPTGSILKEMDMKWVTWPAEAEISKLYVKGKVEMSAVIGAVLREGLHANEPFYVGRVVQPNEQGFLAAVLTPGKRAVAITLTPSSGVAGFIFPGDRVDVILTHTFSRKDSSDLVERHVSETILSDVRVLALDQKSDSNVTDPKVAQLATLEVTPKQAEKVALASDLIGQGGGRSGALSLSLRSLAIQEQGGATVSNGVPQPDISNTTTWDSDVSPAYPSVNGEDGLMQRVQVMRGKESSSTTFERRR